VIFCYNNSIFFTNKEIWFIPLFNTCSRENKVIVQYLIEYEIVIVKLHYKKHIKMLKCNVSKKFS